jgi:DUF4097 and DUF4098 domain-containing protein YvlB
MGMPMMLMTLMLATLVAAPVAQQTDTIVPVPAGARLDLELMRADVTVRTWDRREVRIVSQPGPVEVRVTDGAVRVRTAFGRQGGGMMEQVAVQITVPRDVDVSLDGQFLNADLQGMGGEVSVSTLHGTVRLEGGRRYVQLQSLQGSVECTGAEGRIDLGTNEGSITATGVAGEIRAHSVNGQITLRDSRANSVDAYTLNGGVDYAGSVAAGGEYSLATHAGDVTVAIPERAGVTIEASTFGGAFESDFPLTLQKAESGGRTVSLSLGDGKARMKLNSFAGTIRLRRP